jgi:acetoacetate decarboxylase
MSQRKYPIGYTAPLSPDGRASLVPPPPWHYSGDFLIVEYRTNPDNVIALLPKELEPADDPGAVAAIFADWQSCSGDFHELVDPIQAQYKEFFLVVGCKYQGKPASRCVYIWVDKDFAMYRGWIQGFPKKLGAIHLTRTFAVGKAAPKTQAGSRFGATCTAGSREIARQAPLLMTHPCTTRAIFPPTMV